MKNPYAVFVALVPLWPEFYSGSICVGKMKETTRALNIDQNFVFDLGSGICKLSNDNFNHNINNSKPQAVNDEVIQEMEF